MVKHRLSVCQSATPAADAVLQHLENMLGARDTALCENVTIGRAAIQSVKLESIKNGTVLTAVVTATSISNKDGHILDNTVTNGEGRQVARDRTPPLHSAGAREAAKNRPQVTGFWNPPSPH